jgi:hypothetical protein
MNRSRRNSNQEDRFTNVVDRYENSIDELRRNFNSRSSWWDARNDVQNVMNDAQQVNSMMNQLSFRQNLENQWRVMRTDINTLADTFDLPGLDGGGWQGGGGWNPGNPGWGGGRPPSWAVGTFYGISPQDGRQMSLTISTDGSVVANIGGGASYGTLNGTTLHMNGAIARVTRQGNGIVSTRTDNGERIVLSRTNSGPGWGGTPGWGGGGNMGNVPSWAVGTFSARNPLGRGLIVLTIASNGSMSASFDNGPAEYGTVYGDQLTFQGATSRLERTRNGIRAVRTDNGETINYIRR